MSENYKPKREILPGCELPENLDLKVWHYMDFWKFVSFIQKRSLYLCRGDQLQDKFEGTYSKRQIQTLNEWYKSINEPIRVEIEEDRRKQDRKKVFITCWCVSEFDLDLMWKAYTTGSLGVAIRSTIKKLQDVCESAIDYWPLDICQVNYFDHEKGENIDYWGAPNVFINKDHHFKLDNEIRIMHWANYSTPPGYVYLPVDIEILVDAVVTKPGTSKSQLESVISLMKSNDFHNIPVIHSRDDRAVID